MEKYGNIYIKENSGFVDTTYSYSIVKKSSFVFTNENSDDKCKEIKACQ